MPRSIPFTTAILIALVASLAGCNSSTQALDARTAAPAEQPDAAAAEAQEVAAAKVLRKPATVTQKGNYIVALVNGEPITSYDVERRKQFRVLRRLKATQDETVKEMIDERLKMQEAGRRGQVAGDAQVEQAFARFAASNKSTPSKIAADLDRMGVGSSHFKQFIRTQISWSRTVGQRLQNETRQKSQTQAIFELRKSGAAKPETTEYTLKQVIFVVPADKRQASLMKTRREEALAFAQRFGGCDTAIQMAKGLRDVAVQDLGRMMLPELPANWSEEIQKTAIGKTTGPKETDKGVELIAVCSSRIVADDRAAELVSESNAFDELEQKGDAAADELLAELRKNAIVVYK